MSIQIFEAIRAHDPDKLTRALRSGAHANAISESAPRWRPLHAAIDELDCGGPIDNLVLLLRGGAMVDFTEVDTGATPLLMATFRGQVGAVRLLLAAGASACPNGMEGDSPLRYAVEKRWTELAELLLRCGAEQTIDEAGGPSGMTALGRAAFQLDREMVVLLLQHGASLGALDADQRTPRQRMPARCRANAAEWDAIDQILEDGLP